MGSGVQTKEQNPRILDERAAATACDIGSDCLIWLRRFITTILYEINESPFNAILRSIL